MKKDTLPIKDYGSAGIFDAVIESHRNALAGTTITPQHDPANNLVTFELVGDINLLMEMIHANCPIGAGDALNAMHRAKDVIYAFRSAKGRKSKGGQ